jgi:hypothetical protein
MNQLVNNFHLQSAGIGGAGFTLAQIVPGNSTDLVHLGILIVTSIVQIIHLLKKNKKES